MGGSACRRGRAAAWEAQNRAEAWEPQNRAGGPWVGPAVCRPEPQPARTSPRRERPRATGRPAQRLRRAQAAPLRPPGERRGPEPGPSARPGSPAQSPARRRRCSRRFGRGARGGRRRRLGDRWWWRRGRLGRGRDRRAGRRRDRAPARYSIGGLDGRRRRRNGPTFAGSSRRDDALRRRGRTAGRAALLLRRRLLGRDDLAGTGSGGPVGRAAVAAGVVLDHALAAGLPPDAVRLSLDDARGMALDPDAEVIAKVDDLFVRETHFSGELVDADFRWHLVFPPLRDFRYNGDDERLISLAPWDTGRDSDRLVR